jgi:hypothetical protein
MTEKYEKDKYDVAFQKADELFHGDPETKVELKRFQLANLIVWGMEWWEENRKHQLKLRPESNAQTATPPEVHNPSPINQEPLENQESEVERKKRLRKERRDRRKLNAGQLQSGNGDPGNPGGPTGLDGPGQTLQPAEPGGTGEAGDPE